LGYDLVSRLVESGLTRVGDVKENRNPSLLLDTLGDGSFSASDTFDLRAGTG
jgi:hypothetical protein